MLRERGELRGDVAPRVGAAGRGLRQGLGDKDLNVTEKLGFRCEGVLRAAVRKRSVMRDEWMLAITRDDWLAHPRRLARPRHLRGEG